MHRVLIVEDDPALVQLYSSALQNGEYEVVTARTGTEGLARIVEGGFALILLDVMMPEMDGLTVLTRLQTQPVKVPNGGIVVMTNLASKVVEEQAKSLGALACIDKTELSAQALPVIVKQWIHG